MPMSPRLLRPRAAGGFDPRAISGLVGWYDAADRSTMFDATSGGNAAGADVGVGRWQDKSGQDNHLTQGTANNRPTLKESIKNGLSILRFDASNDSLNFATATGYTGAVSLFAVCYETSLRCIAIGGVVQNTFFGTSYSAGNQILWRNQSDTGMTVSDANPGRFVLLAGVRSGTGANQSRIRRDGGVINSTGTISGTIEAGSVGQRSSSGLQQSGGDLGEILIYNRAVSDGELSAIESALNRKWAIY